MKKHSELQPQAGPCSDNVQRMFESQRATQQKAKQTEKTIENRAETPAKQPLRQRTQPKSKENVDFNAKHPEEHESQDPKAKGRVDSRAKENVDPRAKKHEDPRAKNLKDSDVPKAFPTTTSRPSRICSANTGIERNRRHDPCVNVADKPQTSAPPGMKRVPKKKPDQAEKENVPTKSKMWIRPRSASRSGKARKTDPVSLYQAYQKDWERFRSNMCESSHSELRWHIREKMSQRH